MRENGRKKEKIGESLLKFGENERIWEKIGRKLREFFPKARRFFQKARRFFSKARRFAGTRSRGSLKFPMYDVNKWQFFPLIIKISRLQFF